MANTFCRFHFEGSKGVKQFFKRCRIWTRLTKSLKDENLKRFCWTKRHQITNEDHLPSIPKYSFPCFPKSEKEHSPNWFNVVNELAKMFLKHGSITLCQSGFQQEQKQIVGFLNFSLLLVSRERHLSWNYCVPFLQAGLWLLHTVRLQEIYLCLCSSAPNLLWFPILNKVL